MLYICVLDNPNQNQMKNSIFNKAIDALNEYMASEGAYTFDTPTKEFSSMDDEYVYLGCSTNIYGKYEIASGRFIPDSKE